MWFYKWFYKLYIYVSYFNYYLRNYSKKNVKQTNKNDIGVSSVIFYDWGFYFENGHTSTQRIRGFYCKEWHNSTQSLPPSEGLFSTSEVFSLSSAGCSWNVVQAGDATLVAAREQRRVSLIPGSRGNL